MITGQKWRDGEHANERNHQTRRTRARTTAVQYAHDGANIQPLSNPVCHCRVAEINVCFEQGPFPAKQHERAGPIWSIAPTPWGHMIVWTPADPKRPAATMRVAANRESEKPGETLEGMLWRGCGGRIAGARGLSWPATLQAAELIPEEPLQHGEQPRCGQRAKQGRGKFRRWR
jgi:hypothetical protein